MINTKRRIAELEKRQSPSEDKPDRICIIDPNTQLCRASFVRTKHGFIGEGGTDNWICPEHGTKPTEGKLI